MDARRTLEADGTRRLGGGDGLAEDGAVGQPQEDRCSGRNHAQRARNVLDGNPDTYWYAGKETCTPELALRFDQPIQPRVVGLREYLPLGQRVEAFAVDTWQDGDWQEVAQATSIGYQRLLRIQNPPTPQVRLRFTQAPACPAISAFRLYE